MENSKQYFIFETKFGHMGVIFTNNIIQKIYLPFNNIKKLKKIIIMKHPETSPADISSSAKKFKNKIINHFEGKIQSYDDFLIDISKFTSFEQKVFLATKKIPWGQSATYKGIAEMIKSPKSYRAVGTALSKNPFPIIIPCHRVVSQGGLGGFSSEQGVWLKKNLLELEGNNF